VLAYFQKSGQLVLDLIYPPRCVNCASTEDWFCQDCLNKIVLIAPPVCQCCGTPSSGPQCKECAHNPLYAIDGIRSAAYFEDNPIRSAIHFLKYRDHKAVASTLGQILADAYDKYQLQADVIVPVPLHPSRYKERGYNQSELLVKALALNLALPIDTVTLQRIRITESQMTLGISERHQNVKQAFACGSDRLAGKRVLLIDDVCTTGSTLDACATALKESGVTLVWGLTLARAR
jgi:ComF family protein